MKVHLRNWELSDVKPLVKHANNPAIWNHLTDAFPHPYTEKHAQDFVKRVQQDVPKKIMAIDVKEEAVGSIGIFPDTDIHQKNAAIGYWVAEPFWGKGIATEAIRLIVRYGFLTFDITRIYAKPFGSNPASQSVLEKTGFIREAVIKDGIYKNHQYHDEYIYSIRKNSNIS